MCGTGVALHHLYEVAEQRKAEAAARCSAAVATPSVANKQMVAARQQYVETFANWLSHRAFCQDCKPGAPAHRAV